MQFTHLLAFGFDCLLKLHNAVLALMGGELTHPRTKAARSSPPSRAGRRRPQFNHL